MDFLKWIQDFISLLFDKTKTLSLKIITVLSIIILVFIVNDILGLSYYYSTNQKLSQLKEIAALKKEYANQPDVLNEVLATEKSVITRQTIIEKFLRLFSEDKIDDKFSDNSLNTENGNKTEASRSQLYHTLTSSWGLILIVLILPFAFFSRKQDLSLILGTLAALAMLSGFIWLSQFLLGLIPVIDNKPWINYILNFIIHSLVWIGFIYQTNKNKR